MPAPTIANTKNIIIISAKKIVSTSAIANSLREPAFPDVFDISARIMATDDINIHGYGASPIPNSETNCTH